MLRNALILGAFLGVPTHSGAGANELATETLDACSSTSIFDERFKSQLAEIGWSPLSADDVGSFRKVFTDGLIISTSPPNETMDWENATLGGLGLVSKLLDNRKSDTSFSLFIQKGSQTSTLLAMQFDDGKQNVLRCIFSGEFDSSIHGIVDATVSMDKNIGITQLNPEIEAIHIESLAPSTASPDTLIHSSSLISRFLQTPAAFDHEPRAEGGFSVISVSEK